jgi:dipeptidyl aminopeptidase/acylaminoacyl peptidase
LKNIFVILLFLVGSFSAHAKPMTMADLLNVPSLNNAQLSPDGNSLLYVQSLANWDANLNMKTIWKIGINGRNPVQMSSNVADATAPKWSPNGQQILFISKRGNDEKPQVYIMPATGGEALRFTNHNTAVSSAQWSPNGNEIYFIASDEKSEDQIEREEEKDDIFKFEQNYQQKHLWRITVKDKLINRVTDGDFSVTNYKLSPDGKNIIHQRSPNPLLDAALQSEIWIMDADGQDATRVTYNKNPEGGVELSPDNKSVLYIAWTNENDQPYFEDNLFIISASGNGRARQMLGDFDHDIEQAHWSKDGNSIYFKANLGVHSELFSLDIASGEITELTSGEHTVRNWQYSPPSDSHALSIRTAHNNGDYWHLKNGRLTQVTNIFNDLARQFDLPTQEIVTWKGADGVQIEGTLIYPDNYKKGTRYPLVVQTHGGPRSSDQWGIYAPESYAPILATNGYAILRPNYRGSLGYGDAFVRDMVGHYFNQSHLDVMAGVDHLIEQGIVDGDKLVKMGYSAGGHMTNKIITYTDRFKAASSAAGTVNWISMYSQSDTRIYRTPWFGGTPWQENAPIDVYWDQSPLKDIAKVKTPTMIIVGGADVRVPKQQSIELYRALKSNGVDTDLYIVPREQHGWKELRHKLSKMNVEMSWFEKYVKGKEFQWHRVPTPPPPPMKMNVLSK